MESYYSLAELIYHIFRVPIYFYLEDSIIKSYPSQDAICFPPTQIINNFRERKLTVLFTEQSTCFCQIACKENPDLYFLFGPVSSTFYTAQTLNVMHKEYVVSADKRELFDEFFRQIPVMTYLDFFHIMRAANYMFNHEIICLDPFLNDFYVSNSLNGTKDYREQTSILYQKKDNLPENNSYEIENKIMKFVELGDINGIKDYLKNMPAYRGGIIANNSLRLYKNYFISTITLATRTAIQSGVPTAESYHLSDLYINKMETLNSLTNVNQLFTNALFDITAIVRRYQDSLQNQFLEDMIPVVRDTIRYVRENVEQPLSVQSIASALGYSRTYLSKQFSDTLGFCLRDYISRCKLEESKFLLSYTDKSLSEISEYLYFSSQSHFQLKFKKTFHITPAKYREKTRRKSKLPTSTV